MELTKRGEALTYCMATFNPAELGSKGYGLWNKGAIAAFLSNEASVPTVPEFDDPAYMEGWEWGGACKDPIALQRQIVGVLP